ncbi:MAG: class I SAM-dependent methyltransferase [Anaerolineae bacterium]|jgi:SAM-dependent methyltransferase
MRTSTLKTTWRTFAPREQKAHKITGILVDFLGGDRLRELQCLDIGCGTGEISRLLAGHVRGMVALDCAFDLVHEADNEESPSPVRFLQADGVCLPFGAASFDVVICAQLYEHVARVERLPKEVHRVLKPGGVCFFSGPNKAWPIEPHYKLPFLHWLPSGLASAYLRASGRGDEYAIRPYTHGHLRQLWNQFDFYDQTLSLLDDPHRTGLSGRASRLAMLVPTWLFRALYFLLPNYNWMLVKPDEE